MSLELSVEKFKKLSKEDKIAFREKVKEKLIEVQSLDPFWGFEPTSGILGDKEREFLRKYLKPEDIPEKVDGQLAALRDFSDIVGSSGGNQSGKSASGAVDGYIKHTGELPDSLMPYEKEFEWIIERARKKFMRGRVVGVDGKQVRNTVLPTWQEWCPRKYLKNGSWSDSFKVQDNLLTLYRGKKKCGQIEFMTNEQDPESFQGPPLDWVKYDEEPRLAIYKENMLRFTTAEKLDVRFYWTPTKGLSWATDLFQDGILEDDTVDYSINLYKLCSVNNPKANMKTLATILSTITDYNELMMRLLGEFVSLTGLVYGRIFDKNIHVIKPFDIKYWDHIVYRGLDPHLVKPSVCVELAVDRMQLEYVIGCYMEDVDTQVLKANLAERAKVRKYRLGWTACDRSADSNIKVLGDRNVFRELSTGKNAIPAMMHSEKFAGSIHAGVDTIKQQLKDKHLFMFDIPENKLLIKAFQTLERETYANEDKKGLKDRIAEGKHDAHAALRYIHQRRINWMPAEQNYPQPEAEERYV